MKRFILINTELSILFILLSFHIDAAIIHFLIAGEIPGTRLVVSPDLMMFGNTMLFIATVTLFVRRYTHVGKKHSRA